MIRHLSILSFPLGSDFSKTEIDNPFAADNTLKHIINAYSIEETCLQDYLVILKRMLHNYLKILKTCLDHEQMTVSHRWRHITDSINIFIENKWKIRSWDRLENFSSITSAALQESLFPYGKSKMIVRFESPKIKNNEKTVINIWLDQESSLIWIFYTYHYACSTKEWFSRYFRNSGINVYCVLVANMASHEQITEWTFS